MPDPEGLLKTTLRVCLETDTEAMKPKSKQRRMMCTVLPPPFWPVIWVHRKLLAELTPFRVARRLADKIIERDRTLIREYRRRVQDPFAPGREPWRAGFSVTLDDGFYFVQFKRPVVICAPQWPGLFPCLYPDFILKRSKLRRDQIEYMDRRRLSELA